MTKFNEGDEAAVKQHKIEEVDTLPDNLGSKYYGVKPKLSEAEERDVSKEKDVTPTIVPGLKVVSKKVNNSPIIRSPSKNKIDNMKNLKKENEKKNVKNASPNVDKKEHKNESEVEKKMKEAIKNIKAPERKKEQIKSELKKVIEAPKKIVATSKVKAYEPLIKPAKINAPKDAKYNISPEIKNAKGQNLKVNSEEETIQKEVSVKNSNAGASGIVFDGFKQNFAKLPDLKIFEGFKQHFARLPDLK